MMARPAIWCCWAIESAISRMAGMTSSSEVARCSLYSSGVRVTLIIVVGFVFGCCGLSEVSSWVCLDEAETVYDSRSELEAIELLVSVLSGGS